MANRLMTHAEADEVFRKAAKKIAKQLNIPYVGRDPDRKPNTIKYGKPVRPRFPRYEWGYCLERDGWLLREWKDNERAYIRGPFTDGKAVEVADRLNIQPPPMPKGQD